MVAGDPRWDGSQSQRRSQQLVSIGGRRQTDEVEREGWCFLNGGLVDVAAELQARGLRRVVGTFFVLTMEAFMISMPGRWDMLIPDSMPMLLRRLQKAGIGHPGPERKQPYPEHHPRDGANPAVVEKCAHVRPIDPLTPVILFPTELREIDLDQMEARVNYAVLRYSVLLVNRQWIAR